MNIGDLKILLKNKKISYSKLSENTNIPLSTIKAIFSRKTKNPRLDTLKLICNYLNENTDNLYYDNLYNFYLSEEEKELVKDVRELDRDEKNKLKGYLKALLEYKKR